MSPQAVITCMSSTLNSMQLNENWIFLCLYPWHLLWYRAYSGYSIHIMLNEFYFSKPTPSFVPCAFPLLELFHHYLICAFISFNIFLSTSFFSAHRVFSSLSLFLKRQKSFSLMLPSAVSVLRKQQTLIWSILSASFHSVTSASGLCHSCFTEVAYSKDITS